MVLGIFKIRGLKCDDASPMTEIKIGILFTINVEKFADS